jgi:hypothetical protein
MAPKKTSRKAKNKMPLHWTEEHPFEVPPAVRPSGDADRPADHVLFTPPGTSDTTIEVRRP